VHAVIVVTGAIEGSMRTLTPGGTTLVTGAI